MRQGGGKQKGSAFERDVCKLLSLWITNDKRSDAFWRSAMSGGRATVHGTDVRQAGDICAVAPEGHLLCDKYFIECKAVKRLALDQAIMKDTGPLAGFWRVALDQAKRHNKKPWLIAKQNGWPPLIIYRDRLSGLVPRVITTGFALSHLEDLLHTQPDKVLK